jgi:hypothetical protein
MLKGRIFGIQWDAVGMHNLGIIEKGHPRYCFVTGWRTDAGGREVATAVYVRES